MEDNQIVLPKFETNEWIIEFIQKLDTKEFPNGKRYDKYTIHGGLFGNITEVIV